MIESEDNKEYLPIEGLDDFNKATAELLLGKDHPAIREVQPAPASSQRCRAVTAQQPCACCRAQEQLCAFWEVRMQGSEEAAACMPTSSLHAQYSEYCHPKRCGGPQLHDTGNPVVLMALTLAQASECRTTGQRRECVPGCQCCRP